MDVLPRTIAVTGVAGLLAQRLLPYLDSMAGLERVVGLDVHEPARRMRHFEFHRVDVASSELAGILQGVDTIVHLAGVSEDGSDGALLAHVNVEGTRRVLAAAATVGARRFVSTSSAAVYGAWPNNPVPITEAAPLRPNPGYLPALHDAENERRIAEWCDRHPAATAATLRLAPVVGPGAHGAFARAALGRPPVSVRGTARPIQVVHVDDAVSALALAIERDLEGAYNVAADGWVSAPDVRNLAGRGPLALPDDVARRMLHALWSSGLGDAPPDVLPYLLHPWVVANDRLRAQGWQPEYSNEAAIVSSPWLATGAATARRRTAFGVAAAAGAAGAGIGAARVARRLAVRRARP
jgi:nucleoside-diphosphate-sugar epimerase